MKECKGYCGDCKNQLSCPFKTRLESFNRHNKMKKSVKEDIAETDVDLISRKAVLDLLKYNLVGGIHIVDIAEIEKLPTYSAEQTAEWTIGKDGDSLFVECSKCHRSFGDSPQGFIQWVINNFEYCPKCGSKMKDLKKEKTEKKYYCGKANDEYCHLYNNGAIQDNCFKEDCLCICEEDNND